MTHQRMAALVILSSLLIESSLLFVKIKAEEFRALDFRPPQFTHPNRTEPKTTTEIYLENFFSWQEATANYDLQSTRSPIDNDSIQSLNNLNSSLSDNFVNNFNLSDLNLASNSSVFLVENLTNNSSDSLAEPDVPNVTTLYDVPVYLIVFLGECLTTKNKSRSSF